MRPSRLAAKSSPSSTKTSKRRRFVKRARQVLFCSPEDEINSRDREILRQRLDEIHFSDDDEHPDEDYARAKAEIKFHATVGESGRFNRGEKFVDPLAYVPPTTTTHMPRDEYDDECDDTYEQPMLNLAEGA